MPDIVTVGDTLAWSYANLARAHSALKDGHTRYLTVHHMIRAKLFKGLRTGTMQFGSLFDDERLKLTAPAGCAHCGTANARTIDHLVPRKRGGSDAGDNLVLACMSCNSAKGGRDLLDWHAAAGTFPSLMVLRRYLKLAAVFCESEALLDRRLADVLDDHQPFAQSLIPHDFPPLDRLTLWHPTELDVNSIQFE